MICGTNARGTPPNVLESLTLDPAVTTYYVGDIPSARVIGTWTDGHTEEITEYTTDIETVTKGITRIIFSYNGVTATQEVTATYILIFYNANYSWTNGYNYATTMSVYSTAIKVAINGTGISGVSEGTKVCSVNFAGLSKLYINITSIAQGGGNARVYAGVTTSPTQNLLAGQSFTAGGRQTSTGTKTIDVSSITTTQSILIGGATSDGNTYRIYVDKIWAE